jgi:hypothetical protein
LSLIHNERTKLLATTANNVGTATIVAGVVTPLIAATYGLAGSGMGLFTLLVSVGGFQSAWAYMMLPDTSWDD